MICKTCIISDKAQLYGLSKKAEQILKSQNNKCAICQKELTVPIVDRNLSPLHIRGIVCRKCKKNIDFLNDDFETMKKAIKYLENDNENERPNSVTSRKIES